MSVIRFIVLLLVVIGALNWGLWGFFQYDLVSDIFGGPSAGLARFVYAIIGLAGIWALSFFGCICKGKDSCPPSAGPHSGPEGGNGGDQNQGSQQ